MYLLTDLLNLYINFDKYTKEKDNLEHYLLVLYGLKFLEFKSKLKQELYIQFLSVINPLFKAKEYLEIKNMLLKSMVIINKILYIQDFISPSLIFYPYTNNSIINYELIDIFLYHVSNNSFRIKSIDINNGLSIFETKIDYPKDNIYMMKPNGADDLIGANVIELGYNGKKISRIGFFEGKKDIFISCIQNIKIGRIRYKINNILGKDKCEVYLFELFVEKYLHNKNIIFFTNNSHNCRIYNMNNKGFIGKYDYIANIYDLKEYNTIFWKLEYNKE